MCLARKKQRKRERGREGTQRKQNQQSDLANAYVIIDGQGAMAMRQAEKLMTLPAFLWSP